MHNQPALVNLRAEGEEIYDLAGVEETAATRFEHKMRASVAGQQQQARCGCTCGDRT
jgi:hypothetical protein